MPQIPASTFSYTSILDKNSTPSKLIVQDTTDIAALITAGYSNFGIFLRLTFTSVSGTITVYDNINGSVADIIYPATDNSNTIALPLQANGNLAFGTYSVTAQYQYLDEFGTDFSTEVSSAYEYTWTPPNAEISYRINLPASNITSIDVTNYGGQIVTMTRVHTISPPGNAQLPPLNLPPISTSLATNVYQNITTGTWGVKIVSVVTYQFITTATGMNWQVIDVVSGCTEFLVFSDVNLNALLCCLDNIKKRYQRLLLTNPVSANQLMEEKIQPIMMNLTFYAAYVQAGCLDKAAAAIEQIKEISGCGECACGGDECPTPIPAIVPQNNFYDVDSPDQSITVTSDVIGNTTVFHVEISQTIIDQISSKTYIVNGTSPITVATTVSPDGKTITYTVGTSRPIPYVQNLAVIKVTIAFVSTAWEVTMEEIFTDPQLAIVDDFANHTIAWYTNPVSDGDVVSFIYSDFFTAVQTFVANAQINNVFTETSLGNFITAIKTQNTIEANIPWIEDDGTGKGNKIAVRLYNPVQGEILRFGDLNQEQTYVVHVRVQAVT